MNDFKKETNTKFKSSFLLVLIILAALAVLIWFVVLPRINPPAPPPVPQPPVVIEETIPPPPPPVEPVRAIGDIKPPKLIRQVDPVYPEVARQARVEGVVILECTTDLDGNVAAVKVLRSIPLLDQAAIKAVKQWEYEPMIIDGKAHPVVFTITVRFQLK